MTSLSQSAFVGDFPRGLRVRVLGPEGVAAAVPTRNDLQRAGIPTSNKEFKDFFTAGLLKKYNNIRQVQSAMHDADPKRNFQKFIDAMLAEGAQSGHVFIYLDAGWVLNYLKRRERHFPTYIQNDIFIFSCNKMCSKNY